MTETAPKLSRSSGSGVDSAAFWVVNALVWAGLVLKLTTDWSTNPQYEFGYFVPFFILYLLLRRWEDRPEPTQDSAHPVGTFVLAISLAFLLPIRIVQEANPDWRPLNWIYAGVVVCCSSALIFKVGGTGWTRHFFIPLLLVFFCLPWPLVMEQGMIKELTGAVTRVTVELLNWINVPALQRGNVIEVASGSVGVADACSGMRSLAGTLMASAFFGEYYRLNWSRRVLLIAGGSLIAFGLNIIRTFFLGWRTALEGGRAVENWHDPAGYTIFTVSFAILWILARAVSTAQRDPQSAPMLKSPSINLPLPVIVCFAVWLLGIHAVTEIWYRVSEGKRGPSKDWTIELPQDAAGIQAIDLPDEVRSILRYSEGMSASVEWPGGRRWNVIVLQWDPGRTSAQLATMHRPEICMPAAGYAFIAPASPLHVATDGLEMTFDGSVFETNGQHLYVYRCLWEPKAGAGASSQRRFDMSIRGRLMSSWYGRRNLGQTLVQIAVLGGGSEEEARDDIKHRIRSLIAART